MKIPANITAYYPSNEGVEGGYYDALGKPLNPDYPTCAAPPEIPFHTMIKISDTNTKYDDMTFEVLDRGSAIIIDDEGIYHIDLLMHTREECNEFGRRMGYIEILEEGDEVTVKKPSIINKTPSHLSKYIAGGTRSKTTKIAWHYTGASGVKGINTINNWFNSINRGEQGRKYASSHFVCDLDGKIYSYIPMSRIAWTTNAANYYSIGIECATIGSDDHYSDEEYVSMVKLGAWLAQYYELDPRVDFIRHYDVTKKICPRYFVNHSDKWKQFKLDCYNYLHGKLKEKNIKNCTNGKGNSILDDKISTSSEFKPYIARVNTDGLNARKGAGAEYDIECVLNKGTAITIIEEKKAKDKGSWCRGKANYWVNKKYLDFVRYK